MTKREDFDTAAEAAGAIPATAHPISDQDRHAQFMIEAMKALVAVEKPPLVYGYIALQASKMADAMLAAWLAKWARPDLSPNAPSIGKVAPGVDRLVVALPTTDCWPEHLSAHGRAHGLPTLDDAVRDLLLRGMATLRAP